jgi:hypothetical protein
MWCYAVAHLELIGIWAMELKDFIKNSLCQIAEAILEAKEQLGSTDAEVNPARMMAYTNSSQAYGRTLAAGEKPDLEGTRIVERVEFDVSVTTDAETQANGGIKISIASVNVKAGGETSDKAGSESRIKFSVPMVFPSQRK